MKHHAWILAGTAVGLVMTTAPLALAQAPSAARLSSAAAQPATATARPFARPYVLAQAETENEDDQDPAKRRQPRATPPGEDAAGHAAPADEAKPETPPKQPLPEQETARPEPQPEPEAGTAAPAEEPAPRVEEPAPPAEESAPRGGAAPQGEAVQQDEAAPGPAPKAQRPVQQEEAAPRAEPEVAPAEGEAPDNASPAEDAPDQPAAAQPPAGQTDEVPADSTPETAPRPAPAPQVAPGEGAPEPEPRPQASPSGDAGTAPGAAPAGADQPDAGQTRSPAAQPEGAAPVLDSQKELPGGDAAAGGERPAGEAASGETAAPEGGSQARPDSSAGQPVDAGPPPADDTAAQGDARPAELQPVTAEQGRRIEGRPDDRREERPEGAEVVREIGDRIVIRIDNRVIVESNDRPRIARGARDVYYEELPHGRIREVIERDNGVQIVTIRDRYGDVVRRSRIAPDGRETVLVYVEDAYYDRVRDWRDPGRDLPPMRLTIPVEDYILDARRVRHADDYYDFLDRPPVERIERLYSIDEVKRSARIRDKTRRVDLDTITFDFGSASIAESEIGRLEGVARAMERLLKENPAETFLIEGHTDAVGSDIANLALSDRRAEAVAEALTNVFDIPPENLATQGYGEQYLKVNTQAPERENRRVAIRRITPLVAPVVGAR